MYYAIFFVGINNPKIVQPVVATDLAIFYRESATGVYSSLPYAMPQVTLSQLRVSIDLERPNTISWNAYFKQVLLMVKHKENSKLQIDVKASIFEEVDRTLETFERMLWSHISNFFEIAKESFKRLLIHDVPRYISLCLRRIIKQLLPCIIDAKFTGARTAQKVYILLLRFGVVFYVDLQGE
ncbi:pigment precursor permease [Artemisia annua]|uniref:Pigment permease n=1 Tax=Artemisia annua TaxID=35608 RepID=A0A2U1LS64_ARTAN|nr:pigment precursor permease [Artemisia annua]